MSDDLVKRLRAGDVCYMPRAAAIIESQSAEITRLRERNAALRAALDKATSRARMNDSDGAQVPVDNYHLKEGRRLLDASENVVGKSGGEDNGE